MTAGYSGTPLAEKLDLKRGMRCWFHDMPDDVLARIDPESIGIDVQPAASAGLQCAHLFVTKYAQLERELTALRELLAPNGFIWVSWPYDAPANETDIAKDRVREIARSLALMDVKLCPLDEVWCALKLVIRKELPE